MTIEELRQFAASASCVCGSHKCVLAERQVGLRAALLAAIDVAEKAIAWADVDETETGFAAVDALIDATAAFDAELKAATLLDAEAREGCIHHDQLAELHALAAKNNPTPASPELVAEFRAKVAERRKTVSDVLALHNILTALEPTEAEPAFLAETEQAWQAWDAERDPHKKAILQMRLAEFVAGLLEDGEALRKKLARSTAALVNIRDAKDPNHPSPATVVAWLRHKAREALGG